MTRKRRQPDDGNTTDRDKRAVDAANFKRKTKAESSSKRHHRDKHRDTVIKKSAISASNNAESTKITQNRLTRKFGLYTTGKSSSKVWREYCGREENKARANENLSKLFRLAGGSNEVGHRHREKFYDVSLSLDAGTSNVELGVTKLHRDCDNNSKNSGRKESSGVRVINAGVTSNMAAPREIISSRFIESSSSERSIQHFSWSETSSATSTSMLKVQAAEDLSSDVIKRLNCCLDLLLPGCDDLFRKCHRELEKLHDKRGRVSYSVGSKSSMEDFCSLSQPSHMSGLSAPPARCYSPQLLRGASVNKPAESTSFFKANQFLSPDKPEEPVVRKAESAYKGADIFKMTKSTNPCVQETIASRVPMLFNDQVNVGLPSQTFHQLVSNRESFIAQNVQRSNRPDVFVPVPVTPPPTSSFPSGTIQDRQQVLLRLQDPNDKDILDYVDTMQFGTSPQPRNTRKTAVALAEASPVSDGVSTYYPRLMPFVRLPSRRKIVLASNEAIPRYFRHKLY